MISKLYCTKRTYVAVPKKRNKKNQRKNNKKEKWNKQTTTIQTKTATTHNNPRLNHRWSCYQAIALNDQLLGPTLLAHCHHN